MRFSGDVAATFASRIVLVGLGVISSVLTARYLGPGGRGILATVGALAGIGIQLGNLGLHASNTYLVSRDVAVLGSLWANSRRTATALGCFLALIAAAGAAFMPGLLGDVGFLMLILGIAGMPFHLTTLFGLNLVIGTGRLGLFNGMEIVFRAVGVAGLLACLVLFHGGIRSVLALNLAIAVGGALAVRAVLRTLIRDSGAAAPRTDLELFRASVAYGAKAYTAALLAYLIVRSDMLLVNFLRGTSDAGVYSIAVQVTDLIYLLPMSIGLVLFPRLAREGSGDPAFAMKVTRYTAFLLLLLCSAAALLAKPAVGILYGPSFAAAVPALWWLLPGIWAYGVSCQIATQLASAGMPTSAVLVWIPPLALNLLLNLSWIPRWGISGAAASSTLCYCLVLALHLVVWNRRIHGSLREALVLRRSDLREMQGLAGLVEWS